MQELLRRLPADTGDEALGLALAPLLARNPQEQELVYEKLKECRRRADTMATLTTDALLREADHKDTGSDKSLWKIWLPLGLLSLAVLGLAFWFWRQRSGNVSVTLRQEIVVNTGQTVQLCPSDFPESDSLPGALTGLTIHFSEAILSKFKIEGGIDEREDIARNQDKVAKNGVTALGNIFISNDSCLVYTAGDSTGQDSIVLGLAYSDGKKAELMLRVFVSERATAVKKRKEENPPAPMLQKKPFPHPHDLAALAIKRPASWVVQLDRWWPWLHWLTYGLLALLLYAAWKLWQWKRRKLIAELRNRDKPPYVWNIRLPGNDDIALGSDFAHVLQVLRRRADTDAWRLDLKATIAATAERGGMPEFRFRQQTRPVDYLMLIDRQSVYNHRAQLYDALFRAFREQEIEIARFFFDSDIRLCHNEDHPQGLRLTEIAQRYGDARLIVIGAGTQLISPTNGQLASWSGIFQAWSESVLLTPKPPGEWARNERRLSECFSAVLPASLQSLSFWVEEMEDGDEARFEAWRERVQDAPAAFWQPDPEVPMPLLQMQYDDRMLRWIAACAIYPALHYDLTLWLGKMVAGSPAPEAGSTDAVKRPDTELQPIGLDDLSALFRLRWFVDGQIPQSARAALLDWLQTEDPVLLTSLRLALADLLRQNPPPEDSAAFNDHALSIALSEWLATKDLKRRKELEKQIARLLEAGAEADFVTLKYLDKPRGPLDFEVPARWKKYVYPGGQRALGNRLPLMSLVLAAAVCLGIFVNFLVGNWLYGQMNQCKGQIATYVPSPAASIGEASKLAGTDTLSTDRSICLGGPLDSLLWQERQMLDAVRDKHYALEDSLYRNVAGRVGYRLNEDGWVTDKPASQAFAGADSLLREIRANLAVAYWNQAIRFVLGRENLTDAGSDSACWLGGRAAARYDADPDIRGQYLLCAPYPDKGPKPIVHLLGPIAITVVDAENGRPVSQARVSHEGIKINTIRRQGNKLELVLPDDWNQATVALSVKAEGYLDSLFILSVDSVRTFPPMRLRKAPSGYFQIGGAVRDADSGSPLEGVAVSGYGTPATSDAAGNFQMWLPYNPGPPTRLIRFEFEKVGYETFRQEIAVAANKKVAGFGIVTLKKLPLSATVPTAGEQGENSPLFILPAMVWIPGGKFTMDSQKGDKDAGNGEFPAHRVTLSDFELGKYEVTNEEFVAFLNEKGNQEEGGSTWINLEGELLGEKCRIISNGKPFSVEKGYERFPVIFVSWYGAKAFCAWLSEKTKDRFRLPTEAEWEYAARGGSKTNGYKYSGSDNVDEVAWYTQTTNDKGAQKVGGLKENELGLYDMSGNVYEWCADWYDSYQNEAQTNPTGPKEDGSPRVIRGGSWLSSPLDCRVAYRKGRAPGGRSGYLGFRLARTP